MRLPSGACALALTVTLVLAAIHSHGAHGIRLTATSGPVFDDFLGPAGSAPDGQYWTADLGQSAAAGGLETNTNAAENIRLDGQGHLVIEAVATPTGFTSGRISTVGKVDMLYGSVAARIKLPTGFAIWPAFWLLGSNFSAVSWPQCGEIDLIDMVTDASNFYVGLHGPQAPPEVYPQGYTLTTHPPTGTPLTDGFHTYWVNRRPNYIQIGVDDKALAEYTPQSLPAGGQWVFNEPMYAILNVAVGNAYTGPPNASTPPSATMLVDWFQFIPA